MADNDKLSTLSLMDDGDEEDSLMGADDEIDGILDMDTGDRVDSSSKSDNDTFDVSIAPVSIDLQPVQSNNSDNGGSIAQPVTNDTDQNEFSSLDDFLEDGHSPSSPAPSVGTMVPMNPIVVDVQAPAAQPESVSELDDRNNTQREVARTSQVNVAQPLVPAQVVSTYDAPGVISLQDDDEVEQNVVSIEQPKASPVAQPSIRQDASAIGNVDSTLGAPSKVDDTPVANIPSVILGSPTSSEVDVDSIRKIIAIIDNYRSLDEMSKKTTKSFISTLAQVRNRDIDVSNEAALVKEIIGVDPQMRDAVHNLIDAKSKVGSERVFFLLDLDAESLKNINLLLMITNISKQKLSIADDDIQSLKEGAKELTGLLDQLKDNQVSYIKKLDKVLQSSARILESEDSDDERG